MKRRRSQSVGGMWTATVRCIMSNTEFSPGQAELGAVCGVSGQLRRCPTFMYQSRLWH